MTTATASDLPRIRSDLVIRSTGPEEYVVKCRATRAYFRIGPVEEFLLSRLDGQGSRRELRTAFRERFSERLGDRDLTEFLDMVRAQGLLEGSEADPTAASDEDDEDDFGSSRKGNWFYFRVRLFDPSPILNAIEPRIRWVWTPAFLAMTAGLVISAAWMLWTQRAEYVTSFRSAMRWETFLLTWACIFSATLLHEFAHGLTCKHFGGDVHGFARIHRGRQLIAEYAARESLKYLRTEFWW